MNTKLAFAFGAVLLVAAASWNGRQTAALGQDQPKAQDQQRPDALKQAETTYARALLKVAQADLAKAQEANSKVPETIPSTIVRGLQNSVAVGNARLQAMLGDNRSGDNSHVLAAQEALTFAEENLQQALNANARAPGAVSRPEVDRRQAGVELAKARLEVAKLLDTAEPLEVAQWELLQLQEDVHDLRFRVRLLQYRN